MGLRSVVVFGCLLGIAGGPAYAEVQTLQDALSATYASNPTLQAARAQLRAVDENVPTALAGWRPTVTFSGAFGYVTGNNLTHGNQFGQRFSTNTPEGRRETSAQVTATQQLYRGGRTVASTNRAENQVRSQRATLIAAEQQAFGSAIQAYVNVIQDQQLLQLDINNEQVLAKQLQATNDRFRVGEITRTDVAQAEAALAGATATRQAAEGMLQTARASFEQFIGERPGSKLIEPQPLKLPTANEDQARALAASNNPNVVAAVFNDSAARDFFDVQYSALMPNLSLQGIAARNENTSQNNLRSSFAQALLNLTVPLYQGGAEYAAIRQARQQEQQARKQVDDARRTAVQQVVSAWETYIAAKATIESTRAQIKSNEIALEGVEREAIVGSRTTLDVLNAQQALLQSRTTLVQNLAAFVNASYSVAAAVGRLTARDLNLNVPLYDETAYYQSVHDKWIGTGDSATDQPGR